MLRDGIGPKTCSSSRPVHGVSCPHFFDDRRPLLLSAPPVGRFQSGQKVQPIEHFPALALHQAHPQSPIVQVRQVGRLAGSFLLLGKVPWEDEAQEIGSTEKEELPALQAHFSI